jgi:ribosome recycling factor
MSEDERRSLEGQIQKLTDVYIEAIDDMLAKKESDILSV